MGGDDRTEEAVRPFFTKEMGTRRCHTLRVVCMEMWAAYANLMKEHAAQAQILFDRYHIVKHLNEAVEQVRRGEMRRLSQKEKVPFKRSRWLLLKNPWNLSDDQKERLSTLVRWNTPIVRAYYLKEAFQLFWDYRQPKRAGDHLEKWMRLAMRSRLEPFKKFVRMLRGHLDGILSLDPAPCLKRRSRGNEQQDQVHQPSLVRVRKCCELHCGNLSLLRPATAACRALIALLG